MKTIIFIVGTRPNIIKSCSLYNTLQKRYNIYTIHTGQHYHSNMNEDLYHDLNIDKPDIYLKTESKTKAGVLDYYLYSENNHEFISSIFSSNQWKNTLCETRSEYMGQLGEMSESCIVKFRIIQPKYIFVFGDVTSTLAGAIAAYKERIPCVHIESGLRSHDLTMPEEINRILVDHLSTYRFVTETSAFTNLKKEGLVANNYFSGNTMIDTLRMYNHISNRLHICRNYNIEPKKYIFVTLHRPSNVDDIDRLHDICDELIRLKTVDTSVLFSLHHRTRKNLDIIGYSDEIIWIDPVVYTECISLVSDAKYIITDSGGLQEESCALGIPCYTLRNHTERPCTLQENGGTSVLIKNLENIKNICHTSIEMNQLEKNKTWDGKSSTRIAKTLSSTLKNKIVLVTGGAGFIGSHIVEELCEIGVGELRVIDNLSTGHLKNIEPFLDQIQFYQKDITDLDICMEICKDVDVICHQAALGSIPRSIDKPLDTHGSNVNGFLNILEAARQNGVKRVVFASSSSVYGDDTHFPKLEDCVGNVISPYALTKKIDELYADMFTKTYGLEYIGFRYFNIFGPRQDPNGPYAAVIPKFINLLRQGKQVTIHGDGSHTRDFTYVKNAVHANILAMTTDHPVALNQIYNVGCGERYSILEMYDKICEIMDMERKPIFTEKRKGDVPHSLADINKIQNNLGYSVQYTFSEGLSMFLKFK